MDLGLIMMVVAIVVIIACLIILCPPVKYLLKSKTKAEDYKTILLIAQTGADWAEQWLWNEDNEVQRMEVLNYIARECDRLGLVVDVETMEKALEAACHKINTAERMRE